MIIEMVQLGEDLMDRLIFVSPQHALEKIVEKVFFFFKKDGIINNTLFHQ